MTKRMLRRSKEKRKIAYKELKEIDIKLKKNDKKVKFSKKSLKHNKKFLKQLWKENKSEIKLINYIKDNEELIKMAYGKEGAEVLDACVEALQKGQYLPFDISVEELQSEIERGIEGVTIRDAGEKGKSQISISKRAEEKGISVLDAIKEENKEYEEKNEKSSEQEDKEEISAEQEEKDEKSSKQEGKEEISAEQEEKDEKSSEQEDKEEISAEQEEKDEKASQQEEKEKIERKSKSKDNRQVKEKDQKEPEKDEKEESSSNKRRNFRDELSSNSIFTNTSIDRAGIVAIQKRIKDQNLKNLSPEDFMTFLGYMESQANAGKEVNYQQFLETINKDSTKIAAKKIYSKNAMQSLEGMITKCDQMKEEDIANMSKEEKFMYNVAREYNLTKEKESEEQGKKQEQDLEVG